MKLGAEPKKVALLGVLLVGVIFALYSSFSGSDAPVTRPAPVAAAPVDVIANPTPPRKREARSSSVAEFKIRQGAARPEDRPDPATIDPTLRLDLLAKIQNVEPELATRNLFQYGAAPVAAAVKPIELPKNPPKIAINQPPPPPQAKPGPPSAPSAPPMTFKYYGYKVSKPSGRKEAFLLDGEEIIIAGENDPLKNQRYKIVKIGVNSITIEDTQFKSVQTLPLQEETIG